MTVSRIQGQQGSSSSTWATQVIQTDEDHTLDIKDDLTVATAPVNLTLPSTPFAGERHRIAAAVGVALVLHGAFPFAGGETSVEVSEGTTADFTFLSTNEWAIEASPESESQSDYVVVGAGTAGAPFAKLITDDGTTSCLVLEAGENNNADPLVLAPGGGADPAFVNTTKYHFTHPLYEGDQVQNVQDPTAYTEGRGWGGSSMHNYQLAVRGAPETYDAWAAETGDAEWSYNQMLPLMKYVETFTPTGFVANPAQRGDHGPLSLVNEDVPLDPLNAFLAALAAATGTTTVDDYNDAANPPNVVGAAQGYGEPGTFERSWAGSAWLNPTIVNADGSPVAGRLLTVKSGCIVDRVLFDTTGPEPVALGVVYTDAQGKTSVALAKKKIVLAAGGVFTPAILQRSGIGDAALLGAIGIPVIKSNSNVGANIQCHYGPSAIMQADPLNPPPFTLMPIFADLSGANVGPATGTREFQWLTFPGLTPDDGSGVTAAFQNALGIPPGTLVLTFAGWNLKPAKNGTVAISSPNPNVEPQLTLPLFSDPGDVDRAVKFYKMLANVCQAYSGGLAGMLFPPIADFPAPYGPAADDSLLIQDMLAQFSLTNHFSGSCRMSPDDTTGVVDHDLNVHGVSKLACCDNSVAPEINSGNTAATAYYVGVRLALKEGAVLPA